MKRSHKIATGIALSLSLGLASSVFAHPGQMSGGMGQGMQHGAQAGQGHGSMQHGMKDGMKHGAQAGHGGMQHGQRGGMGHGAEGHGTGPHAAQQLMAPEERTALREKMRNATPEQRQQIASATRTEMQKRAQEKGITLPEHRGPHGRAGSGPNAAPQAPATTEHAH